MHNYLLPEPKVHTLIGKLPPTPENLIIGPRGKRFTRNQHRRYYYARSHILEWLGATRGGYVVAGCPEQVFSDAEKFDIYADVNILDVVMVRPRSHVHLMEYGDRLFTGLLADLAKTAPRPWRYVERMEI